MPGPDVETDLVVKVLSPIWRTTTETAVRSCVDAPNAGLTGRPPANSGRAIIRRWHGHLENLLANPNTIKPAKNHPAPPRREIRQRCWQFASMLRRCRACDRVRDPGCMSVVSRDCAVRPVSIAAGEFFDAIRQPDCIDCRVMPVRGVVLMAVIVPSLFAILRGPAREIDMSIASRLMCKVFRDSAVFAASPSIPNQGLIKRQQPD